MVVEPVLGIGSDVGEEAAAVEKLDEARLLDLLHERIPASCQGAVRVLGYSDEASYFWALGKERHRCDELFYPCPDPKPQLPRLPMAYIILEQLESMSPLSYYIISSVHN